MDKICITDILTEESGGNKYLITYQTEALLYFQARRELRTLLKRERN